MPITKRSFSSYVFKAGELADLVRKAIAKGVIVDKNILKALNDFTVAENAIKDMQEELQENMNKYDN